MGWSRLRNEVILQYQGKDSLKALVGGVADTHAAVEAGCSGHRRVHNESGEVRRYTSIFNIRRVCAGDIYLFSENGCEDAGI